ncbi:hypothetical protein CDO52_07755 [Nocardiopsis gilva YIM 90087]|uniref:Uncharacterized protein n=1 Tax=Nocardiopsis gilva YIM 90087 TaxID=1235441 RepID=A0A223S3I5_9ACTN|nr:hypothetical protein CDO52_07755 [Nocardiopsis gilva YIM 90087]
MRSDPTCPRCGRAIHPPSVWTSAWQCDAHGPVAPLRPIRPLGEASVDLIVKSAQVPVWVPWPLPTGWVITGFAEAGDDRSGALGVVVALSGPAPLGGIGEMAIVAEDPGIGLGARLARFDGPDPGTGFDSGPPDGKIRHDGHEIALWSVDAGKERAVYAGEANTCWMWLVFNPADAGMLMCDLKTVIDLRDHQGGVAQQLPFGAPSPFLASALQPMD